MKSSYRKATYGLLVASLLAACSNSTEIAPSIELEPSSTPTFIPSETPTSTETPTPFPTATSYKVTAVPDSYDFCRYDISDPDPLSAVAAGTPEAAVETNNQPLRSDYQFVGSEEQIKSLNLGPNDFSQPDPDLNKLQVLVVPVGYDDPEKIEMRLAQVVSDLAALSKGMRVEFSFFRKNVPLTMERSDRLLFAPLSNEVDPFISQVNTVRHVDQYVLVANTSDWAGSGGPFMSTVPGENPDNLYFLAHEITGHMIGGLSDSYPIFMGPELNNTELFTDTTMIDGLVAQAFANIDPPIIPFGKRCMGDPVYGFYSIKSVMSDYTYGSQELRDIISNGATPFNPMQSEIMRLNIENILSQRQNQP